MTISQVIARLTALQETMGDIPVYMGYTFIESGDFDYPDELDGAAGIDAIFARRGAVILHSDLIVEEDGIVEDED